MEFQWRLKATGSEAMSYCVNCGVKLKESARHCPLCGVEVNNPAAPAVIEPVSTLPQQRDTLDDSFDKRLWINLVSIIMAVPAALSITANFIFGGSLTWSIYVAVSLALVWVWCVSPFLYRRNFAPLWIVIDSAALLAFLFLIEYLSPDERWFLSLALPITLCFTFLLLLIVVLIQRKILRELHIAAVLWAAVGFFCVFLEGVVDFYKFQACKPGWSLLAFIPSAAFSAVLVLLQRRRWIVEELKHWFRM